MPPLPDPDGRGDNSILRHARANLAATPDRKRLPLRCIHSARPASIPCGLDALLFCVAVPVVGVLKQRDLCWPTFFLRGFPDRWIYLHPLQFNSESVTRSDFCYLPLTSKFYSIPVFPGMVYVYPRNDRRCIPRDACNIISFQIL